MSIKQRLYNLIVMLLAALSLQAQPLSEAARMSLITCTPGDELYAKYGHTALRITDPQNDLDIVFNYGIFDFNTEHFYWKFVRGETWYELGITSMKWFMLEYTETRRPVYEQELQLSAEQKETIWQALLTNYQPENRKYLYNFVFDNCATRPYWLISNALGDTIASDYTGYIGQTYRRFIRHYTGVHSWANAGINLLFGAKADQAMTNQQRLFLPEELMLYMQEAKLSDGTPLVSKTHIGSFKIKSTPWYATWELGLVLYFLCILGISLYDRRRGKWSWGVEVGIGILYGLLLLLITFLVFFSCHPLVGFGWRLLILPIVHLCARLVYILH